MNKSKPVNSDVGKQCYDDNAPFEVMVPTPPENIVHDEKQYENVYTGAQNKYLATSNASYPTEQELNHKSNQNGVSAPYAATSGLQGSSSYSVSVNDGSYVNAGMEYSNPVISATTTGSQVPPVMVTAVSYPDGTSQSQAIPNQYNYPSSPYGMQNAYYPSGTMLPPAQNNQGQYYNQQIPRPQYYPAQGTPGSSTQYYPVQQGPIMNQSPYQQVPSMYTPNQQTQFYVPPQQQRQPQQVTCPSCQQRLYVPVGADVFRCVCGQVLRNPSPVAQPSVQYNSTSTAAVEAERKKKLRKSDMTDAAIGVGIGVGALALLGTMMHR